VTGTHGAFKLIDPLDFGEVPYKSEGFPVPFGGGVAEMGFYADAARIVRFTILENATSERKGIGGLADWNHRFRPNQAPLIFRVKYHDGVAQRDVYLVGRRLTVGGLGGSGAQFKGNWAGGQIVVPVVLTCPYPFFREYTAQATTVAINAVGSAVTTTITNTGDVPIGARFEYDGAGGGSLASITIQNLTAGPDGTAGGTITWSKAGFSDTNELDWRYSDPAIPSWTAGSSVAAGSYIVLWPGPNSVKIYGNIDVADSLIVNWRSAWEDVGN
jgi:hypothetical protein